MLAKRLFAGAVAVLGSLLLVGAASAGTTLFDQNTSYAGTQIISDGSIGRQAADDFVVPAGYTWTISSVDVNGEICVSIPSATVQIYSDASGLPGTLLQSQVVTTADGLVQGGGDGCDLTLPVGFTALDAGHYWLSVVTGGGMWYWSAQFDWPTLNGNLPAFVSPYELGDSAWHPITALIPWWNYDLMFALQGTSAAADSTPPTIAIATPAEGATYVLGEAVNADYSCTDSESGVATCTGPVASGAALDTSTLGSHAFTVDASDNAGNTGSATTHYTVVYSWHGFFQPIANAPTLNPVKAGSSVPVKFGLDGYQGPGILAAGYPMAVPVSCSTGAPIGTPTSSSTAGSSGLGYDALLGQYTYIWKTDKAWAGTCGRFDLKLVDGSTQSAYFRFTK